MRVWANKSASRSVDFGTIATSFMNTTHCDKLWSILRMSHSRWKSDSIIAHGSFFASYCKRSTDREVADDGIPWFFLRPLPI
jgi:hypothetical protein